MLILGCGHIGRQVARHYLDRAEPVLGLVRGAQSLAALEQESIPGLARDLAVDPLGDLPLAGARVFHFAPPPVRGVEDLHTRRLVSAFEHIGDPERLVYISTTGVYGDCEGAWVDETWPARPVVDRARRRWDAEQTLRRWSHASGGALVILRVAGIYGPGRLPLQRIREGLPLVREAQAPFSNRIHAGDLVEVCVAAMERGKTGALYNVCDGNPSTMTDYFFRVADGAGLPRPPVISLEEAEEQLSPGMMSYMRESRRLSNRRMLEELGVKLRFPTLEAGLRGCFQTS
ncbi:MAG: SDR family oxidoreductase [Pseudomonadota bacterium]|nr:SDR family oxidoreductase [Pseudomonadota bacterium]